VENGRDPNQIHYTELPPAQPGSPLTAERDTYRREAGRLIAEGHEGKFALVKGDQIIGLFDTFEDARAEGLRRYLLAPFLVHQIREWERVIRTRLSYQ
jgi:hypothetical protein